MKILSTLLLVFCFTGVFAQSNSDIALIQQLYGMEKREIVSEFITFDSNESKTAFWEIYDAYEIERKAQADQRNALLEKYVTDYMSMGEDEMDGLLGDVMKLHQSNQKLIAKYTKKVKKSVGVKKAAQFYQIENYLHDAIRLSIAEGIPFIGELD